MITGNPMIRVKGDRDLSDVFSHAITFRCWEDDEWMGESNHHAPGIGRWDSVGLPQTFCPGGIRSNIFFPSYVPSFFLLASISSEASELI